jgi:competence protein ComEA
MENLQKKLVIVILLAFGILAYSFHSILEKSTDELVVTVAPATGNPLDDGDNAADREVVVYVSGGVNKPGVYKLSSGNRVVDAVTLAGGFAPGADAAKINLAVRVKDEMQINVPYIVNVAVNDSPAPEASAGSAAGGGNGKININTASAAEFDKLPGIGTALAERIAHYRTTKGPFKDITDIKKVPGIGESKYKQFKDKISL